MYSDEKESSTVSWQDAARIGGEIWRAQEASRRGGADPCCPAGYDPPAPWPTNSGVGGAPPDYRTRGSPMENASPNGGRLKDDVCDCYPITVGGRAFAVGTVRDDGSVALGLPPDAGQWDKAVWVEVNRSGLAVAVPGVGSVVGLASPDPVDSAASSWPPATAAAIGPLVALAAAGLIFTRKKK